MGKISVGIGRWAWCCWDWGINWQFQVKLMPNLMLHNWGQIEWGCAGHRRGVWGMQHKFQIFVTCQKLSFQGSPEQSIPDTELATLLS